MLGTPDGTVTEIVPSPNVAGSAKLYEIDSGVLLRAYRRSEEEGLSVLGVFHSHTHSEAYPSPTDVVQAPDPEWHYVVVSLLDIPTAIRSFHVLDGEIDEEEISL
jgi:proteasome lid subunit RPN8/RPN11